MQAHVDWNLIILGTQVIKKKRAVRPLFSDYLSVSYDYGWIVVKTFVMTFVILNGISKSSANVYLWETLKSYYQKRIVSYFLF